MFFFCLTGDVRGCENQLLPVAGSRRAVCPLFENVFKKVKLLEDERLSDEDSNKGTYSENVAMFKRVAL